MQETPGLGGKSPASTAGQPKTNILEFEVSKFGEVYAAARMGNIRIGFDQNGSPILDSGTFFRLAKGTSVIVGGVKYTSDMGVYRDKTLDGESYTGYAPVVIGLMNGKVMVALQGRLTPTSNLSGLHIIGNTVNVMFMMDRVTGQGRFVYDFTSVMGKNIDVEIGAGVVTFRLS